MCSPTGCTSYIECLRGVMSQILVFYSKIFFSETTQHIQTKLATRNVDHALTLSCAPHSRVFPGKGATRFLPESLLFTKTSSPQLPEPYEQNLLQCIRTVRCHGVCSPSGSAYLKGVKGVFCAKYWYFIQKSSQKPPTESRSNWPCGIVTMP